MNFPHDTPVTPAKLAALRESLARLAVNLGEVEEHFIKGSGPGGQKVNKTASGVQLRYGTLTVKWLRGRSRALNRFLALRELAAEVEARVAPQASERWKEAGRLRRQKDRRRRRRRPAPSV